MHNCTYIPIEVWRPPLPAAVHVSALLFPSLPFFSLSFVSEWGGVGEGAPRSYLFGKHNTLPVISNPVFRAYAVICGTYTLQRWS